MIVHVTLEYRGDGPIGSFAREMVELASGHYRLDLTPQDPGLPIVHLQFKAPGGGPLALDQNGGKGRPLPLP